MNDNLSEILKHIDYYDVDTLKNILIQTQSTIINLQQKNIELQHKIIDYETVFSDMHNVCEYNDDEIIILKEKVVKEYLSRGYLKAPEFLQLARTRFPKLHLTLSKINRWTNLYRKYGVKGLDDKRGKPAKSYKIQEWMIHFGLTEIQKYIKISKKINIKEIYLNLEIQMEKKKTPIANRISYNTFERHLKPLIP